MIEDLKINMNTFDEYLMKFSNQKLSLIYSRKSLKLDLISSNS